MLFTMKEKINYEKDNFQSIQEYINGMKKRDTINRLKTKTNELCEKIYEATSIEDIICYARLLRNAVDDTFKNLEIQLSIQNNRLKALDGAKNLIAKVQRMKLEEDVFNIQLAQYKLSVASRTIYKRIRQEQNLLKNQNKSSDVRADI